MGQNQRTITLAICGVILLGVLQFIALPALDYKANMAKQAMRNRNSLNKLEVLTQEYSQLQAKRKALTSGASAAKGTLFAIVEKVTREQNINDLIESVRPQRQELENNLMEEKVQIRFDGLYQQDLVRFLYTMEKSLQGITVQNVELKRTKDDLLKAELSLVMTTSTQL